ncbi:Sugar ABC transporter, permease protein [Acidilobus saccharovorans 345-15]|uniref:Sugar ABC transporter, permease protein n=1 Tax=Acidilobus saccharovorans (strain DSM 16705 / JCM 18335 / VKM B-2471 / 345-15) TaxID=666510 RepID=D9PZK7_ACIS3|nr:sugar ABC transporter permease [Acidilobus saccharovorans]ADL18495.1 Sugar ABC transporter, permease protein [Acidilobus saccharovorans 345-15]
MPKVSPKLEGLLYFLPLLAAVLFLFLYPLLYSVYISMTDMSLLHFYSYKFVGLLNYVLAIKLHYISTLLINTVIWTVGSLVPMMALGFALALILNQRDLKGKSFFYAILILPWAFPGFISLLVWQGMWVYPYGFMNRYLLPLLHLPPINSLSSVPGAWAELIITNLWLSFPYYMTVFYSGLQSIPTELYELADVDGAGALTKFLKITVPSLRKTIAFVAITSFVFTWNNFYPIYVLTGGGPGISTETYIVYAYQQAFAYNNYAMAAALSIISTLITIVLAIVVMKYTGVLEGIT